MPYRISWKGKPGRLVGENILADIIDYNIFGNDMQVVEKDFGPR
jgi:hypothetical protein